MTIGQRAGDDDICAQLFGGLEEVAFVFIGVRSGSTSLPSSGGGGSSKGLRQRFQRIRGGGQIRGFVSIRPPFTSGVR